MHRFAAVSSRMLLGAVLLGDSGSAVLAQAPPLGAIPATAPTRSVSDLPSAHPLNLPRQREVSNGSSAVQWNGSALMIQASGEDLPSLLAQVSRETGLKVTGGVPDERVFGVYGPGPVQQVLAELFDGLYVNLLVADGTSTQPKELILTPRTGGPTPPSPARSIAYEPAPVRPQRPYRESAPPQGSFGPPQPQPAVPPPLGSSSTAPNTSTPSTDANGQPQSPNGVRTPEQIFEELRKRQAAQQGGAASQ